MPAPELSLVPEQGGLYACLTIDDVAAGDGRRVHELLDWLDEQELVATFFLIPYSSPNQATVYEDKELVDALARAQAAGHEFFPHGYDHDLFECGMPELMAIGDDAMMGKVARALSREGFSLRHQMTRGMIGARLGRSVRIFKVTFGGGVPQGFRSGYHAFCEDLYLALEDLGIKWSSSRTATPGAWRDTVGAEADEVLSWVGLHPFWVGNVLEIPHLADYGSHIAPDAVDDWVGLARRHLTLCQAAQAPFISVAHHPGLRGSGNPEEWRGAGYRAYERIVSMARGEFGARFVRLSDIANAALARPNDWQGRYEYRR